MVSVTLFVLLLVTTFAGGVGLRRWLVPELLLVVVVPTLFETALAPFEMPSLLALPFRLTLVPWLVFWLLLFALFTLLLTLAALLPPFTLLLLLFWVEAPALLAWFTVEAMAGLLLGLPPPLLLLLLLLLFWFWLLLLLLLLLLLFWFFGTWVGDGVGL